MCQQMNCGRARNFSSVPAEQMRKDVWNETYSCAASATSLFSCKSSPVPLEQRDTVATVTCSGNVVTCLQSPRQTSVGVFVVLAPPRAERSS